MPADGSGFGALKVGKYQPNHPEVLAEIAGYDGDREAFEHDNVIGCECCETRFYVGWPQDVSMFDGEIRERDGAWVCEDCAADYEDAASYDPAFEHGTWHSTYCRRRA